MVSALSSNLLVPQLFFETEKKKRTTKLNTLSHRITFARAKALASQFNIDKVLHPLFEDDPTVFFGHQPPFSSSFCPPIPAPFYLASQQHHHQQPTTYHQHHPQHSSNDTSTISTTTTTPPEQHMPVYSNNSSTYSQTTHHPSDECWDLQQLVLGNSSILSDSAPGTPDVTNMFPPHDVSAAISSPATTMAPYHYSFGSMMRISSSQHQQQQQQQHQDDLYCFYQP